MNDVVVGADVGGTSTRVGVADLSGNVLAYATGGPGNPNLVGLTGAADEIRSVVGSALAGVGGTVTAAVIGLAGGSRAAASATFLRDAVPVGVRVPVQLVSDLTVAFYSATPATRGHVLLAGTGSVAGEVVGSDLVAQRGGWGWLLGDAGSAFSLGRAAVRATLEALQSAGALGPLQRDVLELSGATSYQDLLQASYDHPPRWLATFAPLVSRHADSDPTAQAIADTAVAELVDLVTSLQPRAGQPLVLAGSVLTGDGPVSRGVRARLGRPTAAGLPALELRSAESGVVGALWLSLRSLGLDAAPLHATLSATLRLWVPRTVVAGSGL